MLTNPTGGGVRNDGVGAGYYHADRGHRVHLGVDLLLPNGPGQPIIAPHPGIVVRYSFPYQGSTKFSGILLKGKSATSKIWYIQPYPDLIGKRVRQGQVIGIAQDISEKYGDGCLPHIHWQIEEIDPLILL